MGHTVPLGLEGRSKFKELLAAGAPRHPIGRVLGRGGREAGILSVPIEGTHSLSLTVVRAYSAAGGGWAVQQGCGHVLATWLAMAGPCCGGRALALRLDRGSGGASKPHPVTQEVVLDACTGHPTGIHESTGPSCRLWALLGGFGGPGEQ